MEGEIIPTSGHSDDSISLIPGWGGHGFHGRLARYDLGSRLKPILASALIKISASTGLNFNGLHYYEAACCNTCTSLRISILLWIISTYPYFDLINSITLASEEQ
jgi:hypothetical protein